MTLLLVKERADSSHLPYEATFRAITLNVHSSLEAVGLTAAVATQLAAYGISANVIAAYFYDHLFVPVDLADEAMSALRELSVASSGQNHPS